MANPAESVTLGSTVPARIDDGARMQRDRTRRQGR
jgi:hypothetical protein